MRYKNLLIPMGLDPHRYKPHIWGTIASGAASLIGSFVNNEMQKETNQQMIDNQWQMFRAQNERQDYLNENQDLIKLNSLKKAGMNVNAEFGGYPNLNTNSVSQPQLGSPQIDGATLANLMQQAPLIEAQVRNINADTNKKVAETENTNVDTVLKNTQNWQIRQLTPEQKYNLRQQSDLFKEEANKARVSVNFIRKQIELCQSQIANIDVQTSWLLDSYDNRLLNLAQQIATLQSQQSLNYAQCAVAYKSLQVMDKQMRLIESQISLNNEEWLKLNEEVQNLAIDGDYKQFQLNIEKKFGTQKAKLINEQINENIINVRSEMMWRPVSMFIGGVQAGSTAAIVAK